MGDGPADDATSSRLLEFSLKAALVGVVLSLLLGAANMYVGMRAGITVSASIPAAVLSLAILRNFRRRSVQENNIAQTVASAGEALAAGIIFTIPALLPAFLGVWGEVHLGTTILIALTGGLLGVLFAVPLRKALIVDRKLAYPEGVACASVLRAGHGGGGARLLMAGAVAGALFAFLQLGLRLFPASTAIAGRFGDTLLSMSTNLTLILVGVGFLVGLRIASLIFGGSVLAWFVVLPILSTFSDVGFLSVPDTSALAPQDAADAIWNNKIRLVGAGAMFTGGIVALWQLRSSLGAGLAEGLRGFGRGETTDRRSFDLPFKFVLLGVAILIVPATFLFVDTLPTVWQGVSAVIVALVAGFLFSAIAGYMAGLVGSSNNPVSGVIILTLATTAGMLKLFGVEGAPGILGALIVGAIIGTAGAISSDTMQDLKTGHMVGATPWKQQLAQMLGVASFALISPFVLLLLDRAFTIGSEELLAPQAGLMSTILSGFFGTGIDTLMMGSGAAIGLLVAFLGLPVLPVAVGVYLPLGLTTPIFLGGALRWWVARAAARRGAGGKAIEERSTLLASGVIAGEAIAGIALAGLIVLDQETGGTYTYALTPLILAVLVAVGLLVAFGRTRRTRLVGAAALVAGAYLTYRGLVDGTVPALGAGPLVGLLVMGYGVAVIVYLALRPWAGRSDDAP